MALAFVQSVSHQDDTNDTADTVGATVTAGSLLVGMGKSEGASTTLAISDGTSSFTMRGVNNHGASNDLDLCFGYLLVANGGAKTFTFTWGASRPFKWVHIREYSYTGTCSFDVEDITAEGSSTTVTAGAITTTGTDEVVVFGAGFGQSVTWGPGQTIGGTAALNGTGASGTTAFSCDRILTGTMSSGTGTVGTSASNIWVGSLISFKVDAGGGGGSADLRAIFNSSKVIPDWNIKPTGWFRRRNRIFVPSFA